MATFKWRPATCTLQSVEQFQVTQIPFQLSYKTSCNVHQQQLLPSSAGHSSAMKFLPMVLQHSFSFIPPGCTLQKSSTSPSDPRLRPTLSASHSLGRRLAMASNAASSPGNNPGGKGKRPFWKVISNIYIFHQHASLAINLLVVGKGEINIHNLELLYLIVLSLGTFPSNKQNQTIKSA